MVPCQWSSALRYFRSYYQFYISLISVGLAFEIPDAASFVFDAGIAFCCQPECDWALTKNAKKVKLVEIT